MAYLDYKIVKVGVKYMLVCNLNAADILVNGAMDILRKIELV